MKKILCCIFAITLLFSAFTPVLALGSVEHKLEEKNTYTKLQCGEEEIPYVAAQIVRTAIIVLEIVTPLLIIVLGMVDLLKAVIAQKEDEIKKGQQTFVRRLIMGALVFLVFVLVQFIIGFVTNVLNEKSTNDTMWSCTNCFINGKCDKLIID